MAKFEKLDSRQDKLAMAEAHSQMAKGALKVCELRNLNRGCYTSKPTPITKGRSLEASNNFNGCCPREDRKQQLTSRKTERSTIFLAVFRDETDASSLERSLSTAGRRPLGAASSSAPPPRYLCWTTSQDHRRQPERLLEKGGGTLNTVSRFALRSEFLVGKKWRWGPARYDEFVASIGVALQAGQKRSPSMGSRARNLPSAKDQLQRSPRLAPIARPNFHAKTTAIAKPATAPREPALWIPRANPWATSIGDRRRVDYLVAEEESEDVEKRRTTAPTFSATRSDIGSTGGSNEQRGTERNGGYSSLAERGSEHRVRFWRNHAPPTPKSDLPPGFCSPEMPESARNRHSKFPSLTYEDFEGDGEEGEGRRRRHRRGVSSAGHRDNGLATAFPPRVTLTSSPPTEKPSAAATTSTKMAMN
ncbi:hypothetical protein MUK42_08822 [Musa troglodytarum]|uniref:Uncharacterized protein n=1 Tax=Musa troglodytarum TaxID=320322 RepID=A0A9E7JCL9_9LILI|nr:hypothetical protein MUK42_08822 [Musa troglodytarum]